MHAAPCPRWEATPPAHPERLPNAGGVWGLGERAGREKVFRKWEWAGGGTRNRGRKSVCANFKGFWLKEKEAVWRVPCRVEKVASEDGSTNSCGPALVYTVRKGAKVSDQPMSSLRRTCSRCRCANGFTGAGVDGCGARRMLMQGGSRECWVGRGRKGWGETRVVEGWEWWEPCCGSCHNHELLSSRSFRKVGVCLCVC